MFTKESLYGYTRLSLLSEKPPPADIEDRYSIGFCTETWVVCRTYNTFLQIHNTLLYIHITQDKDKEERPKPFC